MKITHTCREITRLVLEGEDRVLPWPQRIAVRWHMMLCSTCPRFAAQLGFMRGAIGRWRQYRNEDAP